MTEKEITTSFKEAMRPIYEEAIKEQERIWDEGYKRIMDKIQEAKNEQPIN